MSQRLLLLFFALTLMLGCDTAPDPPPFVGEAASGVVKIQITTDGIYRVTLAQLQEAGLSTDSLNYDSFALSTGETAVPFHIQENNLIFYGQAPTNRYTAVRTYLFRAGQTGLAMETSDLIRTDTPLNTIIQTQHIEENQLYDAQVLSISLTERLNQQFPDLTTENPWFWQKLIPNQTFEQSLTLNHIANGSGRLEYRMVGVSDAPNIELDHDFELIVNQQPIETIRWAGKEIAQGEQHLPQGSLTNGENIIALGNSNETGATTLDIAQLDWLRLHYQTEPIVTDDYVMFQAAENGRLTLTGFSDTPLIFDVSDPIAPQLVGDTMLEGNSVTFSLNAEMHLVGVADKGFRQPHLVSPVRQSNWQTTTHAADFIILTHDALIDPLQPLVSAREEQGLAVTVVPIAELYDEFGYGEATPQAIQAFLQYAYTNWQQPPNYLLIVGDASSDYRNYMGHDQTNYIPSPMVSVEFSGETISDAQYADIDEDHLPDIAVGRWPITTPDAVTSLVERTLAYEKTTAVNQALFATDASELLFITTAERLSEQANVENAQFLNGASAEELTTQWNDGGAWLTTYIGHGSVTRWGQSNVFNLEAIPQLNNAQSTLVVQLTCLTGLFSHPEQISLSEEMITHEQGPPLIIAATSLTLPTNQEPFAVALLENLQTVERVGDALLQAKQGLNVTNSGLREVSDTFGLLGDPTALIVHP